MIPLIAWKNQPELYKFEFQLELQIIIINHVEIRIDKMKFETDSLYRIEQRSN